MADDVGNGAAGPPEGGHHTNQEKHDQDIFRGEDTGVEHWNNLFWRISFFGGIAAKEDEPGKEGIQGRELQKKADYQNEGKKNQGNGLHKNAPLYKWEIMGILA